VENTFQQKIRDPVAPGVNLDFLRCEKRVALSGDRARDEMKSRASRPQRAKSMSKENSPAALERFCRVLIWRYISGEYEEFMIYGFLCFSPSLNLISLTLWILAFNSLKSTEQIEAKS
jgi:hypothetical protein